MDSTIIENECIDELADAIGIKDKVAAITERAMRGDLDFEAALRERVAMLRGLSEDALQQVYDGRIRLTRGAREMTDALHRHGVKCVLVSGGFTFFTSRIAEAAGFDAHHANTLEIEDGKLTGRVAEPILGADAKLATLRRYARELGIGTDQIAAVGDGANDLPMIREAGFGIGFCAKPRVAEAAGYRIDERDLTKVLDIVGLA
ncbi:MAG: phosphoserine phosphatase SerB [Alphaproteobacteria bacterium]|nr:phosphoserine phosphatase SerB [Alphaproteobacteria bacterium]